MKYSSNLLQYFDNLNNAGCFADNEPYIGTGIVDSKLFGSMIKLQIKFDNNIVKDAKFKAFGCGATIATSSFASEFVKNKTINKVKQITGAEIAEQLSLTQDKIHCAILVEEAIKAAIEDYNKKHLFGKTCC